MDELKLILSSRFMKGIVTKIIAKTIKNKTGYEIDIELNEVAVEVIDGKVHLHVDAKAEMQSDDLWHIVKSNGLI